MTSEDDQLYAGFPEGPAATLPRIDKGPLAFLLSPIEEGWTPAQGAARLRQAVAVGVDIDAHWYDYDLLGPDRVTSEKGRTAAQFLLGHGDLRWLQALQLAGADIHKPDSWQQPTIALAVIAEMMDAVDILLDLGGDMNAPGGDGITKPAKEEGVTPLMLASEIGSDQLIRDVHARGADLERRTVLGTAETALLCAIRRDRLAGVETLLALGADPCVQDGFGFNAVRRAINTGSTPILLALFEAGAPPIATSDSNTNMYAIDLCESQGMHDMASAIRAHYARNAARSALADIDMAPSIRTP